MKWLYRFFVLVCVVLPLMLLVMKFVTEPSYLMLCGYWVFSVGYAAADMAVNDDGVKV